MNLKQISIISVQEAPQKYKTEDDTNMLMKIEQETKASYWNILHVFSILVLNSISLSPQLLIPRHNSIYYPEYYHELPMSTTISTLSVVLRYLMDCVIYTNEKFIKHFPN